MPKVNCRLCRALFYVKPSHQKMGWGKYCSAKCRSDSQFNGKKVICSTCGKQVYRSLAKLNHSKSGKYFCGKTCQTYWRNSIFVEERSPNWVNGTKAYRRILERKGSIPKCFICKICDKRVLSVHHVDHNQLRNSISNLIWVCLNCHYLIHRDEDLDRKIRNLN